MTTKFRFGDADVASTGAFLVGELEKLDPILHEPLADFTWSRDIPVRSDVSITDRVTSFLYTEFAGGFSGSMTGSKSWLSDGSTTVPHTAVKQHKVNTPFSLWGEELKFSIFELMESQKVGRPIDVQKLKALRFKFQFDVDRQAYLGDTEVGVEGLLNSSAVTSSNIGAWSANLTPAQILKKFNDVIEGAWSATQYVRIPTKMLVSPAVFAQLASTQLTNTEKNLLNYIKENNIATLNGNGLEIVPVKHLASMAKIVAYTQDDDVIRLPLVDLQAMQTQFRDYNQVVPYYAGIGGLELVRPEMVYYGALAD